jgi:hypothetical protein
MRVISFALYGVNGESDSRSEHPLPVQGGVLGLTFTYPVTRITHAVQSVAAQPGGAGAILEIDGKLPTCYSIKCQDARGAGIDRDVLERIIRQYKLAHTGTSWRSSND